MSASVLGPKLWRKPQRIVSLVPSVTEAVFQLGCGRFLVGRTRYCVAPEEAQSLPVVGGTKDVSVEDVLRLQPDLVLAVKEENPKAKVQELARTVAVLVLDVEGPEGVPDLWHLLGSTLGCEERAAALAREVESLLVTSWEPQLSCVYFVWQGPFMAAGPDTYVSRLLACCGFANAIPPGSRRYPIVGPDVVLDGQVRVHFYPDEPYAFALPDALTAWGMSVEQRGDGYLLDGRISCFSVVGADFTWYPSRTAQGILRARDIRRQLGFCKPKLWVTM